MQQVRPHHEEPLLDGNAHSVRYGEMIHDGSGKPEKVNSQEEADSETFVMGSDAAEFVNKVKDQVRSRQKRMSNVADSGEEHSIIWGMFMAATMNAATFMEKNFMDNQNSIKNSTDLRENWGNLSPSQKSQKKINVLYTIDCVPSNVQSSHQEALLYVFEDNEAVIKMILGKKSDKKESRQ